MTTREQDEQIMIRIALTVGFVLGIASIILICALHGGRLW